MASTTVWRGVVGGDDYDVERYDQEFVVYRPRIRDWGITVYEIVGYSDADTDRIYTDTDYVNIVAEAIAQEQA